MTDFGEKLRSQRESRELSLDEICETTKIRKVYLQALESNDFGSLPGGVFTKGYIRSYAQALGINADRLLEEYESVRAAQGLGNADEDDRAAQDAAQAALNRLAGSAGDDPGRSRRGLLYGAIALVGTVVVAGSAWWMLRDGGATAPEKSAAAAAPERPVMERPAAAEPAPAPTPEPKEEVQEPTPEEPRRIESAPPARRPPPPAPEQSPAASELRISESGVGTGVVDRQLVGQADRFEAGTRVWFWNRVLDGKPGESVLHVWIHDGEEVGVTRLRIGGSHWRTQSNRVLREGSIGSWAVEARDSEGRVLARAAFVCVRP